MILLRAQMRLRNLNHHRGRQPQFNTYFGIVNKFSGRSGGVKPPRKNAANTKRPGGPVPGRTFASRAEAAPPASTGWKSFTTGRHSPAPYPDPCSRFSTPRRKGAKTPRKRTRRQANRASRFGVGALLLSARKFRCPRLASWHLCAWALNSDRIVLAYSSDLPPFTDSSTPQSPPPRSESSPSNPPARSP